MTTYAYPITLNDGECIAVSAALAHYMAHCRAQMLDGPAAPYWAHLRSCEAVLKRLHEEAHMTSTSSACWPDGKVPPDAFER